MKQQVAIDRLQQLIKDDLESFKHNVIIKDGDHYLVFDRYEIHKNDQGFQVHKYNRDISVFGTPRTALGWCIADKYNQTNLANRIKSLDNEKQLLDADVRVRSHLVKKINDSHRREAVIRKITSRESRLKKVIDQLDKCINLAKYWQIRGFNNETARTGRSASPRTSR